MNAFVPSDFSFAVWPQLASQPRMLRATLVTDCRVGEERCVSRSLAVRLIFYKAGYSVPAKSEMMVL